MELYLNPRKLEINILAIFHKYKLKFVEQFF